MPPGIGATLSGRARTQDQGWDTGVTLPRFLGGGPGSSPKQLLGMIFRGMDDSGYTQPLSYLDREHEGFHARNGGIPAILNGSAVEENKAYRDEDAKFGGRQQSANQQTLDNFISTEQRREALEAAGVPQTRPARGGTSVDPNAITFAQPTAQDQTDAETYGGRSGLLPPPPLPPIAPTRSAPVGNNDGVGDVELPAGMGSGYKFPMPQLVEPDVLPTQKRILTVPSDGTNAQNAVKPPKPKVVGPGDVQHANLTGSNLSSEEQRIARSNNFDIRDLFGGYYRGSGGSGGSGIGDIGGAY